MLTVHYELNGRRLELNEIEDPVSRIGVEHFIERVRRRAAPFVPEDATLEITMKSSDGKHFAFYMNGDENARDAVRAAFEAYW